MKHSPSATEKRAAPRPPARRAHRGRSPAPAATETLDLSLRLLERLADAREPVGVSELAREFGSSKATVYRHVQTMARHGFVRQDPATQRYQAGVKLFILGERLRDRLTSSPPPRRTTEARLQQQRYGGAAEVAACAAILAQASSCDESKYSAREFDAILPPTTTSETSSISSGSTRA